MSDAALWTSLAVLLLSVGCGGDKTAGEPDVIETVDTSSPRATLMAFLDACNELRPIVELEEAEQDSELEHWELREVAKRLVECVDDGGLPESDRESALAEAVICLKETLDRVEIPPEDEIPGPGELEDEDGNTLERWQLPGTEIVIGWVADGSHEPGYRFTRETVSGAAQSFETVKEQPYRGYDPEGTETVEAVPEVLPGLYDWFQSEEGEAALVAAFDPDERNPFAPADTSSPRSTLMTFIDSCNELQSLRFREPYLDEDNPGHRALVRRIIDCLDASEVPDYARIETLGEAAICLKEVLDRGEVPREDEIPGSNDLVDEDGAVLERWHVPGTRIVIGRVAEGPQKHEYVFTPGTVARSGELYEDMAPLDYANRRRVNEEDDDDPPPRDAGPDVSPGLYRWYVTAAGNPTMGAVIDSLPEWTRKQLSGLAVWQWFALAFGLAVSVLLFALAYRLQTVLARRFLETSQIGYFLTLVIPVAAIYVPMGFRNFANDLVRVRGQAYYVISFSADLVTLLAVIVVIFTIGNRVTEWILASPRFKPGGLDAQFIRIVSKFIALVVSVIVFIEGGSYLGIPVTTLLASAGVGGLAVALALQDTIKNVFATIVLMVDRPFRVGERIVIKDYDGVVENIGLRSTQLRLLNGHQVTVPNDLLATSDVENIGRRPFIRRVANLSFPLDTPREKIEAAVEKIRAALDNHEGMDPEFPPRVFFNEFNPESFNVLIIYWYHPPKYWDYLAFSEKLNHEIFRAFEEQGVPFSRTVRVSSESEQESLLAARLQDESAS